MAVQTETRLCHVLTDDYGLRAFGEGTLARVGSKAGFNAIAWKLDGEADFKRDLGIDFGGNPVSRALMQPKLPAKTAALIEIAWPPVPPKEVWQQERTPLLRYVGPSTDEQMLALESMFRNPKAEHDLPIGRFVRDDRLGWIEGKVTWLETPVRATLEAQLDIDVPAQVDLLERILGDPAAWDAKARKSIIDGLYAMWLDNWRQDDPVVSKSEFAARMPLDSIGIHREGSFDIWFEDADFFWGHGVLVSGTLKDGFRPAEMHG